MDHINIMNQIKSSSNINKAFDYAYNDRKRHDSYFDFFEMEYVLRNKEQIISELLEELENINNYEQRPAYAFYPPKNNLCYRRMIYLPFKDLVVRYAFTIILAKYIDSDLSSKCFANRIARSKNRKESFLQNFVTESWPKFCEWQKSATVSYNLLLKTDISSFYDSISHEYLIKSISNSLSIPENCEVIELFKKLLKVPVISYSSLTREAQNPDLLKQGLPIGNNTEGFLANVYLKNVDEKMQLKSISFGRYNDDMRIFGNEHQQIHNATQILQELLLSKGLNLNASKTELAEDVEQMDELRSKIMDVSDGDFIEFEDVDEKQNILLLHVDKSFEEFSKKFVKSEQLNNKSAKDFCKSFSARITKNTMLIPQNEWKVWHIERLCEIMKKWKGSSKHASWLIIQSIFFKNTPLRVQRFARKKVFDLLDDCEVSTYGKYRIIHHLIIIRENEKKPFRLIDKLNNKERILLKDLAVDFLRIPAFELNIVSLYMLRILGSNREDLEKLVRENIKGAVPDPIKNALSYVNCNEIETSMVSAVISNNIDNLSAPY